MQGKALHVRPTAIKAAVEEMIVLSSRIRGYAVVRDSMRIWLRLNRVEGASPWSPAALDERLGGPRAGCDANPTGCILSEIWNVLIRVERARRSRTAAETLACNVLQFSVGMLVGWVQER